MKTKYWQSHHYPNIWWLGATPSYPDALDFQVSLWQMTTLPLNWVLWLLFRQGNKVNVSHGI